MQALTEAFAAIGAFMDQGGPVMYAIAALTFVMWALVFERVWYFRGGLKGDVQQALSSWEKRPERNPGMLTKSVLPWFPVCQRRSTRTWI